MNIEPQKPDTSAAQQIERAASQVLADAAQKKRDKKEAQKSAAKREEAIIGIAYAKLQEESKTGKARGWGEYMAEAAVEFDKPAAQAADQTAPEGDSKSAGDVGARTAAGGPGRKRAGAAEESKEAPQSETISK